MSRGIDLLRRLVVSVALLGASGAPLLAQATAALPASGARLRVWSPDVRDRVVTGTLFAVDSLRLTLERGDYSRFEFPWTRIDSVQVSRGHQGGRGRRYALVGGLASGAVLALLAGTSTGDGEVLTPEAAAGVAFVAGAVGGAIVGGTIGAARGRERWEPVPSWSRPRTRGSRSVAPLRVAIAHLRFR